MFPVWWSTLRVQRFSLSSLLLDVASLVFGGALFEHNDSRLLRCLFDVVALVFGGAKRDRTADLLLARQALSQLSYSPIFNLSLLVDGGPNKTRTCDLTLIRRAL